MPIQITGSPTVIQHIVESNVIPKARQHDRAGHHWLEVEQLSEEECVKVASMDGKVHGGLSQRPARPN